MHGHGAGAGDKAWWWLVTLHACTSYPGVTSIGHMEYVRLSNTTGRVRRSLLCYSEGKSGWNRHLVAHALAGDTYLVRLAYQPPASNQPAILFSQKRSFSLSTTSQQYFYLRTNQPPVISQQYFSLTKDQPSAPNEHVDDRPLLKLLVIDLTYSMAYAFFTAVGRQ
jgi:hypothetical protein